MRRVILLEWIDATNVEVYFGVRADDLSNALSISIMVDLATGLLGIPTIIRCAGDVLGEPCRVLGGTSTHTEVTGTYIQGAYTALNDTGQDGLMEYLGSVL